jgi:hypothetical protein
VSDPIKETVQQWLRRDELMPIKTAPYGQADDRLVAEYGFQGGESTVRHLVRTLKAKLPEAYVPLRSNAIIRLPSLCTKTTYAVNWRTVRFSSNI